MLRPRLNPFTGEWEITEGSGFWFGNIDGGYADTIYGGVGLSPLDAGGA